MSTGKYSPLCPHANEPGYDSFKFNCYGEVPAEWNKDSYDEKTMFVNYDDEGFDSYGYSCFDADGEYVGCGNGIDRYEYTEMDYLTSGDLYYYGNFTRMTSFVRNR
jgi:hypothetical protein